MSIGSSLSGIAFSGISSGIDSESIISRLIALERIPITRLQQQQAQIQSRQGVLLALKGQVSNLNTAAASLNAPSAYTSVTATSSKTEVATLTAGSAAQAGVYSLAVSKLAQSHKVASSAQASVSEALNLSGNFVVNGKEVDVLTTDTLTDVARKINETQSGVTASVLNGGTGNAFLTLSAQKTGLENQIQIADYTGTVAQSLGLVTAAAPTFRDPVSGGANSFTFSSDSTAVGTLMGTTGLTGKGVNFNETFVLLDVQTMSLQDMASAINTSGSGATATVRNETVDGTSRFWLEITGITTGTIDDNGNTLEALGFLQRGYGNPVVAAQDAAYSLDGVNLTSASNTVQNVIPDVTITLLKANETTPETSTLTLATNDQGTVDRAQQFVDAYNSVVDFIKTNSAFDQETFQGGLLLGDSVARQVEESIANLVFQDVSGATGAYNNLIDLGFTFSDGGRISLNETTFRNALTADRTSVGAVFQALGEGSTGEIAFIAGTDKTVPTGGVGYTVEITQLATLGAYTAEVAQTSPTVEGEWLTFKGALFGSTESKLYLASGKSQEQIVSAINTDAKLKDLVLASIDGGKLKIESKRYGTTGNFTVTSDKDAAATNSGIGKTSAGVAVTGVDVAGKIANEAATGNGQLLVGSAGNLKSDGLQVRYTGNSLGVVGSVTYVRGTAAAMQTLLNSYTDSINGLFTANDQSLQAQIDNIGESIASINERVTLKEQSLRLQFARMEETIAQLQGQQARLNAIS